MDVLLGLLLLAAVLGLLGGIVYGTWTSRTVSVDAAGTRRPDEVVAAVGPRLADGGFRIVPGTSGAIVLERTFHPWWTILLAVCLFPLGLLFLLVKGRHVLTVTADDAGAASLRGRLPSWARADALKALQPQELSR